MQAVIPGEGRHARVERFRRHFSNPCGPLSESIATASRIPLAKAALKLGIGEEALKAILYRCREKSRICGYAELPFDFRAVPIWLDRGVVQGGALSRGGVNALSEYLKLRSMVRERVLLPVSNALVKNPAAVVSREMRQIEALDDFVFRNLKFPEGKPLLRLSQFGYGLEAPVREYRSYFYSYPDFLEPIVFAAKMSSHFDRARLHEICKVRNEAARADSAKQVSVSLGMRLWIMREIYTDRRQEMLLSPFIFHLMEKILADPVVQMFFAHSYNNYIDPKIKVEPGGFTDGRVRRKILPPQPKEREGEMHPNP